MSALYEGPHRTQFDGSPKEGEGCTPTSGANGARAATGGKVDMTGGQVRALVKSAEETDPFTKGWSMPDLDLAMSRVKPNPVPFVIGTGGWEGVREARASRKMVVAQGISAEFPNGTCSGVFDGAHCVAIHPDINGSLWLLADPICKRRRWETEATLRRYASSFRQSISFGVFTSPVPFLVPPPVVAPTGWIHVTGSFFLYTVRGNPTIGYDATTRSEPKTTKGFSASVGKVIGDDPSVVWGGRDRVWAQVLAPSAYAGSWVDLLDEPQVRHFDA